jgi:hypothetical protein
MWERKQRNTELCLQLLKRGQSLNPTDPAIYQVWRSGDREYRRGEEGRVGEQ